MSGLSDPKHSEGEQISEARSPSQFSEASTHPVTPGNNFKRPRTPPDEEPNLNQPDGRNFTPTSRPQTPLYRTEIKSISKFSDCVIPTIQPGSILKEITVTFGSTYIRKTVIRHFKIENFKNSPFNLEVTLDPLKGTGFSLEFEGFDLQTAESHLPSHPASPISQELTKCTIVVPPMTTMAVPIKWLPNKLGKVRHIVPFLSKGFVRGFRLILVGQVVNPPSLKARLVGKKLEIPDANKRSLNAVLATPGSDPGGPTIATPERIKRLRNAYKVNSKPRDLGWLKESNQAFAELVNFALLPVDFKGGRHLEAKSFAQFSFTWEKLFIRSRGVMLNTGLAQKFKAVHKSAHRNEIKLLKEFNILNNVRLRRETVNLFAQLEPLWLTLALEVVLGRKGVFGVWFEEEQTKEVVDEALFGHVEYGLDRICAELRFLEKALRLLIFLDAALMAELIPGHGRLFTASAEVRSTTAFFARLKDKFFERTEFSPALSFIQAAREDIDLHINDLSQDLRDGIRLCCLASTLTGSRDILDTIRAPAKSYQASVDNHCLLFDLMSQHGIILADTNQPSDIADGDRKKTLGLLWEFGRRWQLPNLIGSDFFSLEIFRLKVQFLKRFGRRLDGLIPSEKYGGSPLISNLLTWVAAVAAFFDLKVTDFTSSFEDGGVICCLVSHYFPRLLPASMILCPPTQTGTPSTRPLQPKRPKANSIRDTTRHNFGLFKRVVSRLGSVPTFVSFRIDGSINEHLVVLYVAHLARRIQTLVTQDKGARRIQTYWRSKSQAQRELEAASAVIVQRAIRVFYFRQQMLGGTAFQYIRQALICIQAAWRRYVAMKVYRSRYQSIVSIQRRFKTKIQRTQLMEFRASLPLIQGRCRGFLAQRRLLTLRNEAQAATKLQALIKGSRQRARFKQLKVTAQTIQQARRRFLATRNTHASYMHLRKNVVSLQRIRRRNVANHDFITRRSIATTTLQANYRRKLARNRLSELKRSNQAAQYIQSYFRKSLAQKAFIVLKRCTVQVQNRRRAALLTRINKQKFQGLRSAALLVQARFRLVTFQKDQQRKRFWAAATIQAQIRRFLAVKSYERIQATALRLQSRRRALVMGRRSRNYYLQAQHAVSCLQTLARHYIFTEHKKQAAAITLQSAWRAYSARSLICHLFTRIKASESIQGLARGFLVRRYLSKLRQATAILQIRRRSCVAVRKLLSFFRLTRSSAVTIQQTWRHQLMCQRVKENFLAIREAATLVSQRRRQLFTMQAQHQAYLGLKVATITSQRVYRHSRMGKNIQHTFTHQRQLITSIQARRRSAVVRSSYKQLRSKANLLCQMRRRSVQARNIRTQYAGTKQRVINIQKLFRHKQNGLAIRSKYLQLRGAAIAIQSLWRMYAARQAHLQLILAANVITMRRRQLIHARNCCERYRELRHVTLAIQQRWRQTQLQTAIHQQYITLRASSVIIQTYWRRHQVIAQVAKLAMAVQIVARTRRRSVLAREARLAFTSLRALTINLQRTFRLYRLGQAVRADHVQKQRCAIMIQSNWRRAAAYQAFSNLRNAASLVARKRRLALFTSRIHQQYLTLQRTCIAIQAQRRMIILRRAYLQLCSAQAVVSRCRWQTILTRQTHAQFSCLKASVTIIQQRYRLIQYGRVLREGYLRAKHAAIVIQAQWRMAFTRTDFEWRRWATTLVARLRNQAILARGIKRQYLNLRNSSITLQRRYRLVKFGKSIQDGYTTLRISTIMIQALWRMASARNRFRLLCHAAAIVAARRRDVLLARRDRQSFAGLRDAAIILQQGFRNIQYSRSIRNSYLLCRSTAISIQAQWRMFVAWRNFMTLQNTASLISQRRRQALTARFDHQLYLHLKAVTITLQVRYRAVQLGCSVRHAFVIYKALAIKIQATWRMFKDRSYFESLLRAAKLVANRRRLALYTRETSQQYEGLKLSAVAIQRRYRHKQAGIEATCHYIKLRRSAILIQAVWRKAAAQSRFISLSWAATLVSYFRRHLLHARDTRQQYISLKSATISIQQRFRIMIIGRAFRGNYEQMRSATVSIQSQWRSLTARTSYAQVRWAASFVAAKRRGAVLARVSSHRYSDLRDSVVNIQQRYRLIRHGRELRSQYKVLRASAITIQAYWRRTTAQSSYLWRKWASSVIVCQRRLLLLAREERKAYLQLRTSTILIQAHWRMIHERSKFRALRQAATTISQRRKGSVLGREVQQTYQTLRTSATVIQAQWRMCTAESDYSWLRWAATITARRRRQLIQARQIQIEYLDLHAATVAIQGRRRSAVLSRRTREEFLHLRSSAVAIQTIWRGVVARSNFVWLRWAATTVAQHRRGAVLTSNIQQEYTLMKSATIFIQQRYRLIQHGHAVHSNFEAMRRSAIAIQSSWRSIYTRSAFLWLRWAADIVSQRRRQMLQTTSIHLQYLTLHSTAVLLQRRYRLVQAGNLIRADFLALRTIAIKVQALWRGADAKAKLSQLQSAVSFVAQRRRQSVLARATYQQYLHLKSAVATLQAIYRHHQLGRRIRERYLHLRSAAIVIQACWRGVTTQVDYAWLVWAGRVVAQHRRQLLLARHTRTQFLQLRAAATFLQQAFRNNCRAATIRSAYIAKKAAAIQVQALWRRAAAVRYFQRLQGAAAFAARLRRRSAAARTTCLGYLRVRAAAVAAQQTYRQSKLAAMVRQDYITLKSATIAVQAHWRRLVARSNFLWLRWAAQCIAERRTAALQAREVRDRYTRLSWGALVAQRAFRHYHAGAVVRAQYTRAVSSALAIQHALRAYWRHQASQVQAAACIQSHWRGWQTCTRFSKLRRAATLVAACHRARAVQLEYSSVRSAAILVQRRWHRTQSGLQHQHAFQQLRVASITIQRLCRRRAHIRNMRATQIQAAWHLFRRREALHALISHKRALRLKWRCTAAKVIACRTLWRHFAGMGAAAKFSKHQILSSMLTTWRMKCNARLAAIREAQLAQKKSESAAFIQFACRGYLARRQLWAAQTIAIRIQSLYRGHLVRKSSRDEVRDACRGVVRACREAKPHMMLSYRTTEALDILNHSSSLTRIIHACEHLVVVTQLSSACRQRLVNQYHVIQTILELMRSCNRSQPHQEILRHAVIILENISRDPNCDWGRYVTPKEVDDLVVTMLDHKDLHHILTSLMVTLDYLMSHPTGFNAVSSTSQVLTRLRMIQSGMLRHQRRLTHAPLPDTAVPLRSAKYSLGLVGLSSLDKFDQNAMMSAFIRRLTL